MQKAVHLSRRALLFAFPCLLFALSGCGGGGGGSSSSMGMTLIGPDPTVLSVSGTTQNGLKVSLSQSASTIAVNGTVVYTYSIINSTTASINIETSDKAGTTSPLIPASLVIMNSSGKSIFTEPTPAQTTMVVLAPGDSYTETLTLTSIFTTVDRYSAVATFYIGSTPTALSPLVLTARNGT